MVSHAFSASMSPASFSVGAARATLGAAPPAFEVLKNTESKSSKSRSAVMRSISTEPTMPRQPTMPTFISLAPAGCLPVVYPFSAATTASPMPFVPTFFVPSLQMSAVRSPCPRTFRTAASIRSACSARFSE